MVVRWQHRLERGGSTLRPSELQSEMGQPWSRVEKGQAPLLMCLYQATSGPGQSSLTCLPTPPSALSCRQEDCYNFRQHLCPTEPLLSYTWPKLLQVLQSIL